MTLDLLAPLMLVVLVLVLLTRFPVAFSLAAIAGVFGIVGILAGRFDAVFLTAMKFRLQGVFCDPAPGLHGNASRTNRNAEDMLIALNRLFGRVPGGLAYTAIIVGAVLSAITGVVSTSVIALGLISLPVMLRTGYDHRLATGTIAAADTLARILPPSLVLIVLAEQMEVPLIEVYRGHCFRAHC